MRPIPASRCPLYVCPIPLTPPPGRFPRPFEGFFRGAYRILVAAGLLAFADALARSGEIGDARARQGGREHLVTHTVRTRSVCSRRLAMDRKGLLAATLLALCIPANAADPTVAVGSTRYPTTLTSYFGGKPVKMVLTGTALRTKLGMKVYAIGSYVREDTRVRGPHELAGAAVPKQLCLCFEREVDGDTLARSFCDSIGMVSPPPAFAAELAALSRYMKAHPVKKGTCVWLSSTPGVGLRC